MPKPSLPACDEVAASHLLVQHVIVTGCWATSNKPDARSLPGVSAVIGVAFGCNRVGLIETVTFDRPVVLPDGATGAADTALSLLGVR